VLSFNGIRLPGGFDPLKSGSIGFMLVDMLAKQIKGELVYDGSRGMNVEIRIGR
jgi:two-component sensor histidine kinase